MAEMRIMWPQTKAAEEWQQPLETGRGKKDAPLDPSERAQPYRHAAFGLLVFKTVREYVSATSSHSVRNLLRQPEEMNTHGIFQLT